MLSAVLLDSLCHIRALAPSVQNYSRCHPAMGFSWPVHSCLGSLQEVPVHIMDDVWSLHLQ